VRSKEEMDKILASLVGLTFAIKRIAATKKLQRPHPPFITSTLQQSASRLFNFSARKTMMIAQQLYEGVELGNSQVMGLITYMRTDSRRVSARAQEDARQFVKATMGDQFLPATPPIYLSGKGKVQDAHEAIRPTDVTLIPASVKPHLTPDQFKLYSLVWTGFLASQMAPAQFKQTTVDVVAGPYLFRAAGRVKIFDGYLRIYEEHRAIPKKVKEAELPPLNESDPLIKEGQKAEQGFTQPDTPSCQRVKRQGLCEYV
jgi:DNA topoisomerase-1